MQKQKEYSAKMAVTAAAQARMSALATAALREQREHTNNTLHEIELRSGISLQAKPSGAQPRP